jgi:hypothetical protein
VVAGFAVHGGILMAGSTLTYPLNGAANWEAFPDIVQKIQAGFMRVSLTNFDNNSEPQIAAGSTLDVNGTVVVFGAAEDITGWAEIANSTDVYIKVVVSGSSVTAEFTTDAPTWSTSKQGWYVGNDRYIFALYKDGSGNYTRKRLLLPLMQTQPHFLAPYSIEPFSMTISCNQLNLPYTAAAGDVQLYAADAEAYMSGNDFVKKKEIFMPFAGVVNVYFEMRIGDSEHYYEGRVYINGSAVGTLRQDNNTNYTPYNEDITIAQGDLLQLYIRVYSGASTAYCRNFRVRCDHDLSGTIFKMLDVVRMN